MAAEQDNKGRGYHWPLSGFAISGIFYIKSAVKMVLD